MVPIWSASAIENRSSGIKTVESSSQENQCHTPPSRSINNTLLHKLTTSYSPMFIFMQEAQQSGYEEVPMMNFYKCIIQSTEAREDCFQMISICLIRSNPFCSKCHQLLWLSCNYNPANAIIKAKCFLELTSAHFLAEWFEFAFA